MTGRDRIVVTVLAAMAVLVAAWLLVVSPERKQAAAVEAKVTAAQAQLSTAEGQLANARGAQQQYSTAYTSIVSLGKAVPASEEVPSLIYQLSQASNRKEVEFSSISTTTAGGSSASAAATAATAAASAGFSQMPFTFVFNGSFDDLYRLFRQLNHFTVRKTSGELLVSGRLLTIQSTKLAPISSAGSGGGVAAGKTAAPTELTGTVTATAYVLPASQGLTAGATPGSPAGAASAPTPVSTSGATSSPAAPAIVKASP